MLKENLSLIRGAWNLNQQEFADLCSVTKGMYQSYESGSRRPDLDFIFLLEDLTGIPAKRLWRTRVSLKEIPDSPLKTNNEYVNEAVIGQANEMSAVWKAINEINAKLEKLTGLH